MVKEKHGTDAERINLLHANCHPLFLVEHAVTRIDLNGSLLAIDWLDLDSRDDPVAVLLVFPGIGTNSRPSSMKRWRWG